MKTTYFSESNKLNKIIKTFKKKNYNEKKLIYKIILVVSIISLSLLIYFHIYFRYRSSPNNINNKNFSDCSYMTKILHNRKGPFEFEDEFFFFSKLIECNIPISLIRFGDGENLIMKGNNLKVAVDKWHWRPENKNFQKSLIESTSICVNNNKFIGIPCKNWFQISESILSFSKCTSSKYMTYATIFINKNFKNFQEWILHFINSSHRWKIILVANSNINKNISWAEKFFPVPDHLVENWDIEGENLLSKLSEQAKINNQLFFISAGPAANIIVSKLSKINQKNSYIDFGSSIEFITKGYSTRPYSWDNNFSKNRCESFRLQNKILSYS